MSYADDGRSRSGQGATLVSITPVFPVKITDGTALAYQGTQYYRESRPSDIQKTTC